MFAANAGDAFWLVLVSMIWGSTNPLIKKGGEGIEKIKRSNPVYQLFSELFYLASNWKYIIPFLLNQSGSVIFYLTLATADVSLAVPLTNSLTFAFTTLAGRLLGEPPLSLETYTGMAFVSVGVAFCVVSKP